MDTSYNVVNMASGRLTRDKFIDNASQVRGTGFDCKRGEKKLPTSSSAKLLLMT